MFLQNSNQWEPEVRYRSDLSGGQVFLMDRKFIFCYQHPEDIKTMDELFHSFNQEERAKAETMKVRQHAYTMTFENAQIPTFEGTDKTDGYYNFFVGNERDKWASNVPAFRNVVYQDLYPGIDVKVYSQLTNFKYDFIVQPGSDPNVISLRYDFLESLSIENRNLVLTTSVNEVVELSPYSYQIIEGKKQQVSCEYVMTGNVVNFYFPEGYTKEVELIIDPIVVASTHSGSTSTIYGHSAAYDLNENIFSAGAGFSPGGLPISTGAFQSSYGGNRDHCISKYNPNGSSLIFATYVGGSGADYPHSMVTGSTGDLYILGSTSSANFPTSATALQVAYGGGIDISITKLDPTGSMLLGSTYIGGSNVDGQNYISGNYGDSYRGEIVLDSLDNPYVASMTRSTNFPVSVGCWQNSFGGNQDGVLFKLSNDLSSMTYSTYIGGVGSDAAYGLIPDGTGGAYVTGSVSSQVFPNIPSAAFSSYNGGTQDAFIVHFNASASTLLNVTYFGTTGKDQGFFIENDRNGDIYIFGQTNGALNATSGVYSGPSSGMFIARFDALLNTHSFTSKFGNVAPTAFLVDNCGLIYCAGHGGSSTFDVSPNAIQGTRAGFYILVLEPDATALNYATYYGGTGSHVDGGTSRFDKRGMIYQATCTSSGFPTLPNAYATSNLSSWDVTVFKIDFEASVNFAQASASPSPNGCAPFTVNFVNNSVSSQSSYQWDFNDGSSIDTNFQPIHTFANSGTYDVTLVVHDSTACITSDTFHLDIRVYAPVVAMVPQDFWVCNSGTAQLNANGGVSYEWQPVTGMSPNNLVANPTVSVTDPTTFTVIVSDSAGVCSDTANLAVGIDSVSFDLGPPVSYCLGSGGIQLGSGTIIGGLGLYSYLWTCSDPPLCALDSVFDDDPLADPMNTMTYYLEIIDSIGCSGMDSVFINVVQPPIPMGNIDTILCGNSTMIIDPSATSPFSVLWQDNSSDSTFTVNADGLYWVQLSNICDTVRDSTRVTYEPYPSIELGGDLLLCPGEVYTIIPTLTGVSSLLWNDGSSNTSLAVDSAQTVGVIASSPNCGMDTDSLIVSIDFLPQVDIGPDSNLCIGESIILSGSNYPRALYLWQDGSSLPSILASETGVYHLTTTLPCGSSGDTINLFFQPLPNPQLGPDTSLCDVGEIVLSPGYYESYVWNDGYNESMYPIVVGGLFSVLVTDSLGCQGSDTIEVDPCEYLYIPNAFSPFSGDLNEIWYPVANRVKVDEIFIFNRWGEMIFSSSNGEMGWNGTHNNNPVEEGVYSYLIRFTGVNTGEGYRVGKITLIR